MREIEILNGLPTQSYMKDCPCGHVREWYFNGDLHRIHDPARIIQRGGVAQIARVCNGTLTKSEYFVYGFGKMTFRCAIIVLVPIFIAILLSPSPLVSAIIVNTLLIPVFVYIYKVNRRKLIKYKRYLIFGNDDA